MQSNPGCGHCAPETSPREPGRAKKAAWLPLLAIGLAFGAVSPLHTQTPARRSTLIVGRVIDAGTGQPISGAEVIVHSAMVNERGRPSYQWTPRILTSSDGYFVFRDIPPDKVEILVTKAGYAGGAYGRRRPNGPSQPLTLGAGERIGDFVIKLWKHAVLSGTVTDEAGEPLVAVFVRGLRKSLIGGHSRLVATAIAITDDRGIYRLSRLLPGDYVVVTSSSQVAVPLSAAQEANTAIATLVSAMGGSNSLPGGSTAIQTNDTVFPLGRGTPIPAPSLDGRLFIYPPTFHPSSDGSATATSVMVSAGEERTGVDLRLQPVPTVRVSGSIVAPDSAGVTVPVRLRPAGAGDAALEQDWPLAITDANGRFTFPAVPAGDYSLRVETRRQPLYWAEAPLLVGRHDIDGIAVSLQPGLRISGRVAFDGQSTAPSTNRLGQVPVLVESVDNSWPTPGRRPAVSLDSSGQFTSEPLPAGRYFIRVTGSPAGWMFKAALHNGRDLSEVPADLHSGDVTGVVLTFTDRWTSLSGMVQPSRGASGMDVEATVLVFPVDPQAWRDVAPNPRRIRSVTTGKNGEFSFSALPSGDYYAVAVPDEYAADWQEPALMQTLTRVATRVTIGEGEHKKQDLRVVDVR